MKIAYYPGCSLHSTGVEYDISTRKVCRAMGIELVEVKDWICCGSSPAHQYDELMSVALPAKNLALVRESDDLKEICAPCASCYSRLKAAQRTNETGTSVNRTITHLSLRFDMTSACSEKRLGMWPSATTATPLP